MSNPKEPLKVKAAVDVLSTFINMMKPSTTKEISRMLDLSQQSLYLCIKNKKLPTSKLLKMMELITEKGYSLDELFLENSLTLDEKILNNSVEIMFKGDISEEDKANFIASIKDDIRKKKQETE